MPINVNTTDFPKLMASMVASARAGSGGGGGGSRGPAVVHGGGGGGVLGSLGGTATSESSSSQINAQVNIDPILRLLGYKTQEEMINDENRFIELLNGMSKADQDKFISSPIFQNLGKAYSSRNKSSAFMLDREKNQYTLPTKMPELRVMGAPTQAYTSGLVDTTLQKMYGTEQKPDQRGQMLDFATTERKAIPPEEAALRQAQTRAAEFEGQKAQYLLEQEKQYGPQERANKQMLLEAQIQEHRKHSMAYEHQSRLARIQADQLESMEHPKIQQSLENTKRLYYSDLEQADKNNSLQLMQGEGKLTGETKWGVVNSYFNVHDRAWRAVDSTFASEKDKTKMAQHARPYVDSGLVRLEHAFYQKFPSSTKDQVAESGNRQVFLDRAINMVRASQQSAYNSSGDINNWDSLIMIANLAFHTVAPTASQENKVNLIVNSLSKTGISNETINEAIFRWQERYKKLQPKLYDQPTPGQSSSTLTNFKSMISDSYGALNDPMVQFGPGYRDPNSQGDVNYPSRLRDLQPIQNMKAIGNAISGSMPWKKQGGGWPGVEEYNPQLFNK